MSDINTFANDLLIDFADAMYTEIRRVLEAEFGEDWLTLGVRKHFKSDQFARVESMLRNPMRVVDMNKSTDEIHSLEHFWNIINGNWNLFGKSLRDQKRTEVYLGGITELRNNLAHRLKKHVLLRPDLVRIAGNCRMILSALGSNYAESFADAVDILTSGGSPWGPVLAGHIPPSDEIYAEFVGRPTELETLADWFTSDSPQILVWGYGGAGKSALAYKFARDIKDGSAANLIAVCWISAKRSEYIEGATRNRPADFHDKGTLIEAIWSALYGEDDSQGNLDPSDLIKELRDMPILLVVDDFDTVSDDEILSEFLLHDLRMTPTRVLYTSRQRVPGVKNLEVPPFSDDELSEFVSLRAGEYELTQGERDKLVNRLTGIRSITGGYPLFVDDLIHHARLVGADSAMRDWSQKKGDAAREYALRRQIEYLGQGCGDVLIALSVADRALIPVEISNMSGLTDEDSEAGLRALLQWRMVNQVTEDQSSSPMYRMNLNTSRLVKQTFKDDNRLKTYAAAFRSLTGERVPEAKKRAIGRIIYETKNLERSHGFQVAQQHLTDNMTGELADSPDLYGVLGWLCAKQQIEEYTDTAREAFVRSHRLGSSKVDTYFHWVMMEKRIAEWMIAYSEEVHISSDAIADQWKECERIAEMGIDRCGSSQLLCYWAGYAASREAKARERAQNFVYAQGAYTRSVDWFNQALEAPTSDVSPVAKGAIYRGLTLAFEGMGDEHQLQKVLSRWYSVSGEDSYIETEISRLLLKFPGLRNVRELQSLIQNLSPNLVAHHMPRIVSPY